MSINITEQNHRVVVTEDVVRVISVGVVGPPGPQGPAGDADMTVYDAHLTDTTDVHGIADTAQLATLADLAGVDASLPTTTTGDLIVHGATEPVRLPVGAEGEALTVVSGIPAWGAVASGGSASSSVTAGKIIPTGSAASFVMPGYSLSVVPAGTVPLSANACCMIPIMMVDAGTFDYVAITVGSAAAGASMRLGIYAASESMRAAALIQDFGVVAANTTGTKLINLSPMMTLAPGYYFLACVSNTAGAVPEAILSGILNGNVSLFSSTSTASAIAPRVKSFQIPLSGDPVGTGLPDPAPTAITGREDVPYMRLRLVH